MAPPPLAYRRFNARGCELALRGLVYRGRPATERRADQRAFLASDQPAHASAARRRTANHHRGLLPGASAPFASDRSLCRSRTTIDGPSGCRVRYGRSLSDGHESRLQRPYSRRQPRRCHRDDLAIYRLDIGGRLRECVNSVCPRANGVHRHAGNQRSCNCCRNRTDGRHVVSFVSP